MSKSCSDIFVKHRFDIGFGHNEDASPAIKNTAYLVTIKVEGGDSAKFMAYNYPGLLPGNAWGFNEHSVIFTCNEIDDWAVLIGGIGRNFVTRDLFNSKNLEDAIARVANIPNRATGWSLNLGSIKESKQYNVEIAPGSELSVWEVKQNYSHFNMYRHLNVSDYTDESSVHRLERSNEFPRPENLTDVATMLGDTKDPEYPIYRDGQPPDDAATVCTALFNLQTQHGLLYLDNPKLNFDTPYMKFSLRDL